MTAELDILIKAIKELRADVMDEALFPCGCSLERHQLKVCPTHYSRMQEDSMLNTDNSPKSTTKWQNIPIVDTERKPEDNVF